MSINVAAVSVISSAVVALATISANVWQVISQRKHDVKQGFETRSWEKKVDGHLTLIRICGTVSRWAEEPRRIYPIIKTSLETLRNDVEPVVAGYGTDTCRSDVSKLASILDDINIQLVPLIGGYNYWVAKREELAATDPENLHARVDAMKNHAAEMNKVEAEVSYDPAALTAAADAALKSGRASLRGLEGEK